MSLILEALKKLDREKQTPDRGFLIVGSAAWPSPARRLGAAAVGLAVLGLVAAAAIVALWPSRTAPRPDGVSPPVARATSVPPAVTPAAAALPSVAAPPSAAPVVVTAPAVALPGTPAQARRPPAAEAPAARAPAAPPPVRTAEPADAYRLTAISQKDGRPVAILNDRLVREGDSFDGVRVVRIGEAEVEIEVGGRRMRIGF